MTENDLMVCERFKEIRTSLKMKQGDFAKEIKTTQGHVSDIENKRKSVSDRIIEIIHLKYNVNEEWLRTGNGEMFVKMDKEAELMTWAGSVLGSVDESFKKRFVKMLSELDDRDWETLEKIALKLHNEKG